MNELDAVLHESGMSHRAMFVAAGLGMAQVDAHTRRFLSVNPALAALTGHTEADLLAMTVDALTHSDDLAQDRARYEALLRGDAADIHIETRYVRKDEGVIWVEVTANLLRDAAGRPLHIVTLVQDVTARRESEEAKERDRARLAALAAVTRAMAEAGPNPDTVLAEVAHQAAALLGDLAVVRLLSADGRWLEPAAVDHADTVARDAARAALASERHPADQGANGAAVRTGRAQHLTGAALEAERHGKSPHLWPSLPPAPTTALLAVPLRADGRAIGTLSVSRQSSDTPYVAEDERFLQELADRAGLATARARLFAQVRASEEHARFLAEASAILAASLDYDEAVERVVRLAVPTLADWGVVDLLGADGALHRLAIVHGDPERVERAETLRQRYPIIPASETHTAWRVLRSREPWFDPEVATARFVAEARDEQHLALLKELGFASELIVPLVARGRALGVLTLVLGNSGRRFRADDVAFAEELARHCALAIDNAALYREAREAEARVRRLFDAGVIGLIVAESERILEANDHFLRMVGYTRDDLDKGRMRWVEMTPPEYADLDERAIAQIAERGYCAPYEKEYTRKDGSRVPVLIGIAAIQGKTPPWICGVVDLTAQKAAEQDRVAFVDAATHDLKNPLTSLKGQVQLLLRRVRRDQELDVGNLELRLEAIDADASRMVSLIDELMDAAHLRTGRMLTLTLAPTDLVALAHACADDARRRATHVISTVSSEDELIGVWDRSRLERVIQNLLNNAVKYSSPGSPIEVHVRCEDAPDGPPWAVLSVRDEGVGIPADDLPRIFERFHRGGNVSATPGAGIGLSGAKQIVEQHGGTIAVESVENQGSTFTIRLPLGRE